MPPMIAPSVEPMPPRTVMTNPIFVNCFPRDRIEVVDRDEETSRTGDERAPDPEG